MKRQVVLFDCEITREEEDELQMSCFDEEDLSVETPMKEVTSREWITRDDLIFLLITKGFSKISILGYTQKEFSDEDDELIQELKAKLENAWGFVDNIREHLDELESDMDNLSYDIDHAKDDCDSALYELED